MTNANVSYVDLISGIGDLLIKAIPISDESRKIIKPLAGISAAILSKIVDPMTLSDAYMINDLGPIYVELSQYGITAEEVSGLIVQMSNNFGEAQLMMRELYIRKLSSQSQRGIISEDDVKELLELFDRTLIRDKSDLMISFPFNGELADTPGLERTDAPLSVGEVEKAK